MPPFAGPGCPPGTLFTVQLGLLQVAVLGPQKCCSTLCASLIFAWLRLVSCTSAKEPCKSPRPQKSRFWRCTIILRSVSRLYWLAAGWERVRQNGGRVGAVGQNPPTRDGFSGRSGSIDVRGVGQGRAVRVPVVSWLTLTPDRGA